MTRFRLVNEDGTPLVTFGDRGLFPPRTYGSMTEAVLALIFEYPDCPDLRPEPVRDEAAPCIAPPLSPRQPRMES